MLRARRLVRDREITPPHPRRRRIARGEDLHPHDEVLEPVTAGEELPDHGLLARGGVDNGGAPAVVSACDREPMTDPWSPREVPGVLVAWKARQRRVCAIEDLVDVSRAGVATPV